MSEQYLKQIDRMARQIDESHSALRNRNATIEAMREEIKNLRSQIAEPEDVDARLEAWNSGYAMGKTNGKRMAINKIVTGLTNYKCTCLVHGKEAECYCQCARWALDFVAGGGIRE